MNKTQTCREQESAAIDRLREKLRQKIGFDAASLGAKVFARAVRARMTHLGIGDPEEYLRLVEASPAHWNQLVESVLVTETWFFRDPEVFRAFGRLVAEEWLPAHPTGRLRILSLACASGEEPFSAALALLEAGLTSDRFQVDAVDLCGRQIACARAAVYGPNSFRGRNLDFRDRYFERLDSGQFALRPSVRNLVRFHEGNVLDESVPLAQGNYDVVFCRNLLIYFDPATQHKVLRKVEQLLAFSGQLFVSPAEQGVVLNLGFVPGSLPRAFAVPARRPALSAARLDPEGAGWQGSPALPASMAKEETRARSARHADREPCLDEVDALHPGGGLEEIRRLADAGCLDEAAAGCETHLRRCRACAEGYYLLGLVREAQGDARALESYRRALYLRPDYYEALSHMAILAQQNGDPAAARNFRRRAERSQPTDPQP